MGLYDYAASANCYKVRLLLAQLGRQYERVPIDIFAGDTLTEAYAAINPQRATPVLETGDGRRLTESNAILWYLAEGTRFLPDDPVERAEVLEWLILEQTDVMMGIGGRRFRLMTLRWTPDEPAALQRRELAVSTLTLLEEHLHTRTFLVAERYTIADVAAYASTHVAPDACLTFGEYPSVAAWLTRVEAEPGFMDDLVPYPPNATAGKSHSVYD